MGLLTEIIRERGNLFKTRNPSGRGGSALSAGWGGGGGDAFHKADSRCCYPKEVDKAEEGLPTEYPRYSIPGPAFWTKSPLLLISK
jgi:hypothetical protein